MNDMTQAGSVISNGDRPLERLWSVRLPGAKLDRELNRMLLREAKRYKLPGFRKGSKVVPPSFRRQNSARFTDMLVHRMAQPSLQAKLLDSGLQVLPSVLVREHNRIGDEIEVTYQFEVRPDVPPPALEGKKLLHPRPDLGPAVIDKIIERMRWQAAKWNEVVRPAQMGDRVRFLMASNPQPQMIELVPGMPGDVVKTMEGACIGDKVELNLNQPGEDKPAFQVTVEAILEADMPPLDLEFARSVTPDAGSVEAFRQQITEQVAKQGDKLARTVLTNRVLHLLDVATGEFEMPAQLVEAEAGKRREALLKQSRQQGKSLVPAPEAIDVAMVRKVVGGEIRRGLILQGYVEAAGIKVTDEEIAALAEREAQEHDDPQLFIEQSSTDPEIREAIRRVAMHDKVIESVVAKVMVEDVKMDLEQLNQAQQGMDPALAQAPLTPPNQAVPAEQEHG